MQKGQTFDMARAGHQLPWSPLHAIPALSSKSRTSPTVQHIVNALDTWLLQSLAALHKAQTGKAAAVGRLKAAQALLARGITRSLAASTSHTVNPHWQRSPLRQLPAG